MFGAVTGTQSEFAVATALFESNQGDVQRRARRRLGRGAQFLHGLR
jgi:hypothetical protein